MMKPVYRVFLQLSVLIWLPVCHADCVYQECFCSTIMIMCSDKNLQSIPHLNTSVTGPEWSLGIDGNNISSIPSGSLPSNLTFLYLQKNPITTIADDSFDGSVNTLVEIYMSNSRFTKLPDAFGRLRTLTTLSITDTNITDWNDGVWNTLGQTLETLTLDNVGITKWPSWTTYFTKLTDLTVTGASFSTIPDNALEHVANSLTSLNLYNNRLTMIPKAISSMNNLQDLFIFQNHITDLTWLPLSSKLTTLSLSNNYISNASHLSEALRPISASLSSLDIDNNFLTAIPDFSFLTNVNSMDLSHNRIYDSYSGHVAADTYLFDLSYNSLSLVPRLMSTLVSLQDVTLPYNAIKAIQETDFHSQVTSIDLGYNLITAITDTSFPHNFSLMYLQLNNNPLTTISPGALLRLPQLYELSLSHTQLTRLPLALSHVNSLVSLDVTNSTSLVCTCQESSLASWVLKLRPENVAGNCGQTSVYYFFSTLSPFCPNGRSI
ncbi:hypothetical protein BsWGS_23847 [Bradybaena similaris]